MCERRANTKLLSRCSRALGAWLDHGFFPSPRPQSDILCEVSDHLPDELPPSYEFGGYVIGACIGRGGMAHVYRAVQAALHREVALKVVDRWVLDTPHGSERFLREATSAASIKHPNVVDILDVGVWRERPFIVMELLTGCDLETHLERKGPLSDVEVAALALPIIAGVMAVHEAGVVHRDLKPSNIFLSDGSDGEVIPKVLDFGVSKTSNGLTDPLSRATDTREILGTPSYMAPEALNGVRDLGVHADQYSIGAVLYECAVGRPPYEGETLGELLKVLALGKVEPPSAIRPGISPALEDAILRAIHSDPSARFAELRDFGRALWPLADERTRAIWARSFGDALSRPRDNDTTNRILDGRQRPFRPKYASWLRKGWVRPGIALSAVGALALFLAFGEGAEQPRASAVAPAPVPGPRQEPIEDSPRVEAPERGGDRGKPDTEAREARVQREPSSARRGGSSPKRPKAAQQRRPTPSTATRALRPVLSEPLPEPESSQAVAEARPGALDDDLEELFGARKEAASLGARGGDPELRGLFRGTEMELGVNDAPIPD